MTDKILDSTVIADCNFLADPDNGVVVHSSTIQGSSATYTCDVGYDLVGIAIRVCQSDAQWTSEEPTCESKKLWIADKVEPAVIGSKPAILQTCLSITTRVL